jgi:GT2 family glycosyltransferase
MSIAPVTAMIPAHRRIAQTVDTVRRLRACVPAPAEIIAHVHARETPMIEALARECPQVRVLQSPENLGPGGARNRMIEAASHELVASFDDDSYPFEGDFFARLPEWFAREPGAAILALHIFEPHESPPDPRLPPRWTVDFVGCGCAYRRSVFLEAPGYVPIPIAYSMEEADLGLRYTARDRRILFVPALRVFHDTRLSHHADPMVAASQIANLALFLFLRYPPSRWPLGLLQVGHKGWDTLRRRRFRGALLSPWVALRQILRYRSYRATVSARVLDLCREMRRTGGAGWRENAAAGGLPAGRDSTPENL